MADALAEARAAGDRGEVPVGAVVVDGPPVNPRARRQPSRRSRDPSAHAEILAFAPRPGLGTARLVRLRSLRDARALPHVRGGDHLRAHPPPLLRCRRPQEGRRRARARIFDQPTCHHHPEIIGDLESARPNGCCGSSSPPVGELKRFFSQVGDPFRGSAIVLYVLPQRPARGLARQSTGPAGQARG